MKIWRNKIFENRQKRAVQVISWRAASFYNVITNTEIQKAKLNKKMLASESLKTGLPVNDCW